jgi:ABC-type transport system substrate-binding protein
MSGSALLEEAGWSDEDGDGIREAHGIFGVEDDTPLSFRYWTTTAQERVRVSEIIKMNLFDCGIEVTLEYFSFDEFFNYSSDGSVAGRDYDAVQFAYSSEIVPACDQWLSNKIPGDVGLKVGEVPWLLEELGDFAIPSKQAFIAWDIWNNSAYVNPTYDSVCLNALATLPGEEAYDRDHFLAQEIIMQDLPMIPLYWRNEVGATRPDLCGYNLDQNASSELWNVESIAYGSLCE